VLGGTVTEAGDMALVVDVPELLREAGRTAPHA
jgi:hypothetical protein